MVNAVKHRLNWRGRKVRVAAITCVAAAGLAAGFFGGSLQKVFAVEAKQKYCVYEVATPLPAGCTLPGYFSDGQVGYFCYPCSQQQISCDTISQMTAQVTQDNSNCAGVSILVRLTSSCSTCGD